MPAHDVTKHDALEHFFKSRSDILNLALILERKLAIVTKPLYMSKGKKGRSYHVLCKIVLPKLCIHVK